MTGADSRSKAETLGVGEMTLGGSKERTEESVVRAKYMSRERGTMVRYLEPGDVLDAPADRVALEALESETAENRAGGSDE